MASCDYAGRGFRLAHRQARAAPRGSAWRVRRDGLLARGGGFCPVRPSGQRRRWRDRIGSPPRPCIRDYGLSRGVIARDRESVSDHFTCGGTTAPRGSQPADRRWSAEIPEFSVADGDSQGWRGRRRSSEACGIGVRSHRTPAGTSSPPAPANRPALAASGVEFVAVPTPVGCARIGMKSAS